MIKKYDGEVYYIRGLDCWDSHTYHKKAVEHRIATTCDIFERDMDLEGIKNILITNNYWVQIAKFNGRKEFNPKKIIAVQDLEIAPTPKDSLAPRPILKYSFDLNENAAVTRNWSYSIIVNNYILEQGTYKSGSHSGEINEDKLVPGYNQVEFIVKDNASGKILANVPKYYFDRSTGAVPLIEIPYASHKQAWGNLHKNASIEGNAFKVDNKFYNEGFGIHASSETAFNIGGKFKTFRANYSLDEESLCSDGAQLQVIADGQIVFDSGKFSYGKLNLLNANVENSQTLTIKTFSLENIDCDHVDIINPALIP